MKHILKPIWRLFHVLLIIIMGPIVITTCSLWDFNFKKYWKEWVEAFESPMYTNYRGNDLYYNWTIIDYIFDRRINKRKDA